jgi:hypothetical protein
MSDDPRIEKSRFGIWECYPREHEIEVMVAGDQWVTVDKLFGPQCSSSIRVKHDLQTGTWVVEEQNFHNDEWVERARFDAQEFYKDEYQIKLDTPPLIQP